MSGKLWIILLISATWLAACAGGEPDGGVGTTTLALTSTAGAPVTRQSLSTVPVPSVPLSRAHLPGHPTTKARLDAPLVALLHADGTPRRDALERAAAYRLPVRGDAVLTTVALRDADLPGDRGDHLDLGGYRVTIDRRHDGLVQAWVPVGDLARVGTLAGVNRVMGAVPPRTLAVSEGVALTGANLLHAAGKTGTGITIGIIDVGFKGWSTMLGTELPASVTTQSFAATAFDDAADDQHGAAVAEIVHDLAPGATLVLVKIDTLVSWQNAVVWLQARPVDLITSSLGSELWEPLDGRGSLAQMASASTQGGVPYFSSAGNSGDGHYYSVFQPTTGAENLHSFGGILDGGMVFGDDTGCYTLPVGWPIDAALIWNDWGADLANPGSKQDYDLYLLRWTDSSAAGECSDTSHTDPGGEQCWVVEGGSVVDQSTNGGAPLEYASYTVEVEGCHALMVSKFSATTNHTLQLFVPAIGGIAMIPPSLQHPEHSVLSPCVGAQTLCVGATELDDTLATYSSQGPTIPSEVTGAMLPKPDVTAPTSVTTTSYGALGFGGTSASAPHAAGVYALLLQLTGKKDSTALSMLKSAALDLGDPGYDTTFGWGRVRAVACTTASCDDGLACTADTCDPLVGCSRTANGLGCWIDGACVAHGAKNPANACQACDQAKPTAWSAVSDTTSCDDGKYCTVGDTCQAGTCVGGAARDCSGVADACHTGSCDETADTCQAAPVTDGSTCTSDGNACTADTCQAGTCTHAAIANGLPCTDDGNGCTADYCLSGLCQHTALANGLPCEDGLYCTVGDACSAGACVGGGARDCTAKNDACNAGTCDEGGDACVGAPLPTGTPCGTDGNECTNDVCKAGACTHGPVTSGTPCTSDGLSCTLDLCLDGACGHTVVTGCLLNGTCVAAGTANPANPCEACDPVAPLAWSTRPNGTPCEDGQYCSVSDTCTAGTCVAGPARDCSGATDACNLGVCSEAGDSCAKSPVNQGGACASDGDACTTDTCDAGTCAHVLVPDDCGGRVCGPSASGCHECGSCQPGYGCDQAGTCTNLCEGVTCPECQVCDAGACVPVTDQTACTADGNACTRDACVAGACTHPAETDGTACDDHDACTRVDACAAGACAGTDPVTCTAADACHVDGECDPATGSCSTPLAAEGQACPDDALDCTSDTCSAGACVHDVTEGCVLDGACVAEGTLKADDACQACDPAHPHEWTAVADATPCDDGKFCTDGDACVAGACVSGAARDCTATADACNTAVCIEDDDACVKVPRANGLACDSDGLDCTTDTCSAGACTHTVVVGCLVDGGCVTVGSLNPLNACQYCDASDRHQWTDAMDGAACNDGLWCTVGDACSAGACMGPAPRDCSFAADPCNDGACDDLADACVKAPKVDLLTACDDGDACTPGSHCEAGACVGEDRVTCPDKGVCAGPGACNGLTGQCLYTEAPTGTACDDGLWCSVNDACVAGTCEPGGARDCSASATQCLSAACDEGTDACVTTPVPAGNPCGEGTSCADGVLQPAASCDGHGACVAGTPGSCAPYAACADGQSCASSCTGDGDCVDGTVCFDGLCRANQAPVADAGDDATVLGNHEIQLDGSGSSDPDGDELTYAWTIVSGPGGAFDDAESPTPTFLAAAVQHEAQVVLQLVVSDGVADSEPDTLTLTVQPLTDLPDVVDDAADAADLTEATGDDAIEVHDAAADGRDATGTDGTASDAAADTVTERDEGRGEGGGSGCTTSSTPRAGAGLALFGLLGLLVLVRTRRSA